MRRTFACPVLVAIATLSMVACAQPPQAPWPEGGPSRMGAGPMMGEGSRMGAGPMMGGRWGPADTPGWAMMSPAERDEHHRRMADARTYEDCRGVMEEHRAQMQRRAAERGVDMPGQRGDPCAGLPPR